MPSFGGGVQAFADAGLGGGAEVRLAQRKAWEAMRGLVATYR